MFDFGQGTPRVLVVLNPSAPKQTLRALDMRAMVDREGQLIEAEVVLVAAKMGKVYAYRADARWRVARLVYVALCAVGLVATAAVALRRQRPDRRSASVRLLARRYVGLAVRMPS